MILMGSFQLEVFHDSVCFLSQERTLAFSFKWGISTAILVMDVENHY